MDDFLLSSYYESLKRYWRRRKYQRVYGKRKRKIQVLRLGGGAASHSQRRRFWRIRRIPKLRLKIISPIKLLKKFHDAYVDMMIWLANKMANSYSNGGFLRGKKVAKARQISRLVSSGEEAVDTRLVMEIYKKLVASRQLSHTDDQL